MDTLTADMLAQVLDEPEKALLARVLKQIGQERCAAILAATLEVESTGGLLLKDGSRRRTPGGTFFQLVKDASSGKERYYIFTPIAAKRPPSGTRQAPQAPALAPIALTLDLWKGLTPISVTATLKLVLRDIPETRENNGLVYIALQNEPRGLPKGVSLESGPLYLSSPAKQWRTACARAEQIRATGTPALLIVEAHVSTKEGALIGVVKGIQIVEGKASGQPQTPTPSA